ncbi:DUF262 domain-containing protein [Chryseobacterium carnipullorum]|uniref:DUF262 domain-containing protein n=1 Tax=Chryseobacterium carnipullorum TaxID=1124835 RepID=A0A376E3J5_CHRCU|nr:DUF262 domain-containing protein [Chryseobacterium carnipullorum]AZA50684.1 DUF262 domain-containing protein [Chryseobacterium carnipullorum]AZA65551.1 DUF262 domain-containing protein [Chryseobacterium carnipullorum]STD01366.1 Uncharacterized conserved protein [Chryseobacterium carnipullorum]
MENQVYYGQYSLQHWIDLILKENIMLPVYQRLFVWDEEKVKTLIETFKNKQFVPPITIGAYKNASSVNQNLILDGQQRLTSVLLAHLGLYPDKATFRATMDQINLVADENDDEDNDPVILDNILEWNLKKLVEKGRNKMDILSQIVAGNYKTVNFGIDDNFLKNTFLGFSYLVPQTNDTQEQQKYYSSVFRNINVQGERLLAQESRAALYFLNENLAGFFDPEFGKHISVKVVSQETKADFVRFLALLSQYAKDGNSNRIAAGYKPKMESYYEDYIYSVIGSRTSSLFKNFSAIFPDENYKPRLERLEKTIDDLGFPKQFPSIIDMDVYLLGLIHVIVFEDKSIDLTQKDQLEQAVKDKISQLKVNEAHKKAPSALKYLQERIQSSIEIYNNYTDDE